LKSCIRVLCLAAALLLLPGCGPPKPVVAHDKPISYWVQSLQGPDANLRKKAAQILGNIGAVDSALVPALSGALKDPDAGVRREAIVSLIKIGPKAKDALSALEEVVSQDENAKVRADAERALKVVRGSP
jgi:HEAT repeat protein